MKWYVVEGCELIFVGRMPIDEAILYESRHLVRLLTKEGLKMLREEIGRVL
jgi:hypothetical protein